MKVPRALLAEVDRIYESGEGDVGLADYHYRHGTQSLAILTVLDGREAQRIAKKYRPFTYGKVVVEIGAGVGILACELAREAKHVYAIEADPAWSWAFTQHLYAHKPVNLTWILGMAESVAEWLRADVAIIVSRSGLPAMRRVAERIAPRVFSEHE